MTAALPFPTQDHIMDVNACCCIELYTVITGYQCILKWLGRIGIHYTYVLLPFIWRYKSVRWIRNSYLSDVHFVRVSGFDTLWCWCCPVSGKQESTGSTTHILLICVWSECRDSIHYRFDAVEPASSRCPPDICIEMVRISPSEKKKTRTANAVLVFLVRVSRFELEASWTPFKRDTKLRHTRICLKRLKYNSINERKNQPLILQNL